MEHLDVADLATMLVGNTPRHAALETLKSLSKRLRARSIALYRTTPDDRVSLELDMGGDEETIGRAREMWSGRPPDGATVTKGNALLLKIPRQDGWLVFADGIDPRSADLDLLVGFAAFAAAVLARSYTMEDNEPGTPTTLRSVRREELVATLGIYEWNIARTARAIGVTRKTVYDRMQAYGIERKRVPK